MPVINGWMRLHDSIDGKEVLVNTAHIVFVRSYRLGGRVAAYLALRGYDLAVDESYTDVLEALTGVLRAESLAEGD